MNTNQLATRKISAKKKRISRKTVAQAKDIVRRASMVDADGGALWVEAEEFCRKHDIKESLDEWACGR